MEVFGITHKRTTHQVPLFLFIFISICLMDILFRYMTNQPLSPQNLLISFLFIATFALGISVIVSFFKRTARLLLSALLLAFIAILYTSQMMYYQFFRTYYSVYSVGNGEQIIEFWQDIMTYLTKHAFWIILLFIPILILIVFRKSFVSYAKISWLNRTLLIVGIVVLHVATIGFIHLGDQKQHSAYDLYFHEHFPLASVQKLGLLTSMRLDLQRQVSGWSPILKPNAMEELEVPEFQPEAKEIDQPSQHEDKVEEIVEHVEPEYHVLDIDFDQLIEQETDPEVKQMHQYFKNVEPTEKNEYTGLYEGYNLIVITAEGFSSFAVNQHLTPTLYKMVHEGYHFKEFYTPIWEVSTSDGEYVALNSLIPKSGVWSFQKSSDNYLPFALGNQLKKLDYQTNAYHNHTYTYYDRHLSHPNMGYQYKGLGNGLHVKETWPESDLEMMEVTTDEYVQHEPFHAYYMTVSGHMQYSFTGNYIAWKNQKFVKDLQLSDQARAYMATQIELDRALEHLLNQLEEAGVADRTLIALSSDHYPYGLDLETIDELVGHPVEKNFELYKNTFILYTKGMDPQTITKPASSLDILPTISNLLGLTYDSRLMMGKDIFSNSPPLIPFLNRSFITDKGRYNSQKETFESSNGESVSEEYIEYMKALVQQQFYYSAKILEKDYYRRVLHVDQ